jgi:DNA-directed RNA polymerase specialized sigma24 family protein
MIRWVGEATPAVGGIARATGSNGICEATTSVDAAPAVAACHRDRSHPGLHLSPQLFALLRRFVARRVNSADDAADIVQETLTLACEEIGKRRVENLPRWLFTVANHLIIDHYRSQRRFTFMALRPGIVDAEPALQTRPDLAVAVAECHERLGVLLHRIARLDWMEHQVAVLMADVYGYRDTHSAAALHMSVPCFKLMLHGARVHLRQIADDGYCSKCALAPVCGLRRMGVVCGLRERELFAVRGTLLEGLKH